MSIGTLSVFEPKSQQWEIFASKVKQFIKLNEIVSEDKKRAVLLTHLSDEAYLLLRNLIHPKEVESSTFDELIQALSKHLTPKRATFADRCKFYNAMQAVEESVEDWAARLRGLAVHCGFGACLDTVYRDRFVLGLRPGAVRDRVCEQDEAKLTFARALDIAQQTVVAKEARATTPCVVMGAAALTKEEPLLWTRARAGRPGAPGAGTSHRQEDRCAVCGMKSHAAETCRYKNYRCQRCKEKGHLMKMCDSKVKAVRNINVDSASSSDEVASTACSDLQNSEIRELVDKYKELFNKELGCYTRSEVSLQLKEGTRPKFCKARPLPFAIKDAVEAELARLVEVGILEPVNHSDYATPIVPVPKSNGSIRICADYSITLNKDIHVDKYPLPRIEEVFAKLGNGQHYSKLDCSQAYNQLKLSDESQKLTTINTTKGLFMYKRLVFGLACAPAIFQRTIENLLAGIDGVTVFLDDVCVTGPTKAIHLQRLEKVFQRFHEAGFRLEKSKCSFFQDSVTYLGHIINKDGLHKCQKKVEAISKIPAPSDVTGLKRFLGMANYYRNFVPNTSAILAPLHELLRVEARWEWTERHQEAFDCMKRELGSDRVLAHFDPAAQLVLTVDAGPAGLGAVLGQLDADGCERPLAFGSRSLSKSEKHYSQLQKEATAIIFGVKRFHQYLYGKRDPFILKTDHKPLLAIFGKKGGMSVTTASRLVRYAIFLSAYNYRIQYTSSKENVVADFFSRAPLDQEEEEFDDESDQCSPVLNSLQLEGLPVTYKDIREATLNDDVLNTVMNYVKYGWPRKIECKNVFPYFLCKTDLESVNGCLLRGHRVVVPLKYRDEILRELHRSHQGIVKTKSAARSRLWWPGVDHDIERVVGACDVCVALRPAPPRATPRPWPRPSGPWLRIHLDYMTVAQTTYLVVIDSYSKWLECLDMSGGTTTKHLLLKLNDLFSRFGLPETIVSDNDAKIASQEFIDYCKFNGISYLTSPIYHPCSNGQAENSVKTCKKMIKAIMSSNTCKHKINAELLDYLLEYRNTAHCSTGASPARLMFGRDLRCRLDLIIPPRQTETDTLQGRAQTTNGARLFDEGEPVWCRSYVNRKPVWYKGIITHKLGNRMYHVKLDINNLICKRHVDQLMRYVAGADLGHSFSTVPTASYTPFERIDLDSFDEWHDATGEEEVQVDAEQLPQQLEAGEPGSPPPAPAPARDEAGAPPEEAADTAPLVETVEPSSSEVRDLRPRKYINYKV